MEQQSEEVGKSAAEGQGRKQSGWRLALRASCGLAMLVKVERRQKAASAL